MESFQIHAERDSELDSDWGEQEEAQRRDERDQRQEEFVQELRQRADLPVQDRRIVLLEPSAPEEPAPAGQPASSSDSASPSENAKPLLYRVISKETWTQLDGSMAPRAGDNTCRTCGWVSADWAAHMAHIRSHWCVWACGCSAITYRTESEMREAREQHRCGYPMIYLIGRADVQQFVRRRRTDLCRMGYCPFRGATSGPFHRPGSHPADPRAETLSLAQIMGELRRLRAQVQQMSTLLLDV